LGAVRLAFQVAERLRTHSVAIDGLRRNGEWVISEISYTYASWAVEECPGHWKKQGDELQWASGRMWPEEAQVADFIDRLNSVHG
jgi:hypothetical protein